MDKAPSLRNKSGGSLARLQPPISRPGILRWWSIAALVLIGMGLPAAAQNLTINKASDASGYVFPGNTITYTIAVTNTSAFVNTSVALTDAAPTGTTYVADSVVLSVSPRATTSVVYNSSSSFVVPAGVTSVTVQAWGGGGGAGKSIGEERNNGGGGGGGGGYARARLAVTPGATNTVTVGAAGGTATAGGGSWFGSNTTVFATGGGAGGIAGTVGAGGSDNIGNQATFTGGTGGAGDNNSFRGGGGGGSATATANGGNGQAATAGGAGGIGEGVGGAGATDQNFDGNPGQAPGGGGGGGGRYAVGGAGAAGRVIITYDVVGTAGDPPNLAGNWVLLPDAVMTASFEVTVDSAPGVDAIINTATVNSSQLASPLSASVTNRLPVKLVFTSSEDDLVSGATRNLTVEVRDAADNRVTNDTGRAITFSKTDGAGTVSGLGPADTVDGVASLTVTGAVTGTITIQAADGALTADTTTFNVTTAPAAKLVFTSSEDDLASGADRILTVEVRDAGDNLLTGDTGRTVTFSKTDGAGTVTGSSSAGTANGVASLTVTGAVAGAITIEATTDDLAADTTVFTIVPGAATKLGFTSSDEDLASGATRILTAEVRDAADNLITNDTGREITFSQTDGAGTVSGLGPANTVDGVASLTVTGAVAGAITIQAAADDLTADTTAFTIAAGAATKLEFTSSVAELASGATRALTAEVRDAADNRVTNDTGRAVTFSQTDGAGTVTGLGSADTANGVASLTVTGAVAGAITIQAADGVLIADTTAFTVVVGAPAKLVFTSSEADLVSGASRVLSAEVRDAADNLISGDTGRTLTFSQTDGAGTVAGLGPADTVAGVASLTVTGAVAGAITIQTAADGLAADTTSFEVLIGAPSKLVVTSSEANLASGSTRDLTAEVRDAADNLVTNDTDRTVTFSKTAGDGTVTGLGPADTVNGVATLQVTGDTAGELTIQAVADGLTDGTTTFTVVAGDAPVKLVFTSSETNLTSGSTRDLTVEVRDAADNLITGDNGRAVTFSKTAGAGTVSGLGSADTVGGVASLTVTGVVAGAITIQAAAASLTADTTVFTVAAGTADKLVFTSSETNLASGSTRLLTVAVRDAADNRVTNDTGRTVTFSQTDGVGTVTGLGPAGTVDGVASLTVTGAVAGAITIQAADGVLAADTTAFTIVAGAADKLVVTSSETDLASGTTRALTAEVQDAADNRVTNDTGRTVTFSKTDGAGTVTGLGPAGTVDGVATLSVTGTVAGAITIQAAADDLTADTTAFTIVAGAADKFVFTSSETDLSSGATRDLTVEVRDINDNLVSGCIGRTVTFSKAVGAGTVDGLGDADTVNGVAALTVTGRLAGAIMIMASDDVIENHTTTFNVVAGPAIKLAFTSGTDDLPFGISRDLTVEVRDANENLVVGDNGRTVTFSKIDGAGTVDGLDDALTVDGVATLEVTGANPGSITIRAAAADLSDDTTVFNVVAGSAVKLVFTSSADDLMSGTTRDLTVEVQDAADSLVTADNGRTVTFVKTDGAGTVTGLGQAPTVNGVATIEVTGALAGSITVQASAPAIEADTTQFTVIKGVAAKLVFTSSEVNLGTNMTRNLTVEVRDSGGNLLDDDNSRTVAFSKIGGAGSVTGLGNADTVNGIATLQVTGETLGVVSIQAADGQLSADTTTFTVVDGTAKNLRIELISGYNFVVRSNVESQPYGPQSAYLGATFHNDGDEPLSNVVAYIGSYNDGVGSTPGIYPSRAHPPLVGPLPGGEFALQHEGGSGGLDDATRQFTTTLQPGESVTVYWLVSYPFLDENGKAVHGPDVKAHDDLWLEFDVWGEAYGDDTLYTDHVNRQVHMRNMIAASANKIEPNTANKVPQEYKDLLNQYDPLWTNTVLNLGIPGSVIVAEGYWFDLGNVNQGFDNDGDLVPDYNAWLQPVGDPSLMDSSNFRLVRTYVLLVIKRSGGQPDMVITAENQLYFTNLPEDNSGVVGYVAYEFMPLREGATSLLSPYQAAASGWDNEKFNSDYGATGGGSLTSGESLVAIQKDVDKAVAAPGETLSYTVTYTNAGDVAVGSPDQGVPLVISDAIPEGTVYVAGSAAAGNTLPAGVSGTTLFYSTDDGATWSRGEPSPASAVTHIQWWLNDPMLTNTAGTVTFQVVVDDPFLAATSPWVINVAGLCFGNTPPFMEDDAWTLITGPNSLSGTVFVDDGRGDDGIYGNAIQDGTEPGIGHILLTLYYDANGNGILDAGDTAIAVTNSAAGSGDYAFYDLPDGHYIVLVDYRDPDLPFGHTPTGPVLLTADLDADGVDPNPVTVTDLDFGFAPVLTLVKTGPSILFEAHEATYSITVSNRFAGDGSGVGVPVTYTTWSTNEQNSLSSQKQNELYENPEHAYSPAYPDGLYAASAMKTGANTSQLGLGGYTLPLYSSVMTNVRIVLHYQVTGIPSAGDLLNIHVRTNTSATVAAAATLTYNLNSLASPAAVTGDVTSAMTWDWARFNPANSNLFVQVETIRSGGGTRSFELDQVGFIVTTDGAYGGGTENNTLEPVPLTDYYDTNIFDFVSAVPPVTLADAAGAAPNEGRLYWANVGPLPPGAATNISVTFLVREPPGNQATFTTNIAAVTNATFQNGVPANTAEDDAVSEIRPTGSIGDFVWRDLNGDGIQDGGDETGIAGVSVVLTPPAGVDAGNGPGNPVTNVTDASGYYLFTGLPSNGVYTVTVLTATLPGGVAVNTYDEDDGTNNPNNETLVDLNVMATDGSDNHLTADFGYNGLQARIFGLVWNDVNQNGAPAPDSGEPGLSGVTVRLYQGETWLATTNTGVGGAYEFFGAFDGSYTVRVDTNSGPLASGDWTASFDTDGLATLHDVAVTVPAGGEGQADFSYYQTGTLRIGDTVFYDWNGNGIQDAEDEGITNVTVRLYLDVNGNGVYDAGIDPLVTASVTDGDGLYLFENLPAGDYLVIVDHDSPGFPTSYRITADPQGPMDGRSAVTLVDADDLDQDFGYQPLGSGAIGDTVWRDLNADGIQFGSQETGISNVTVTLQADMNGDGVYVTVATTVTDAHGKYLFDNLPDGNYRVWVDPEDPSLPLDRHNETWFATTPTSVDVTISGGNTYLDADFGFAPPAAVGDTIWWDANRNAQQDAGEGGIDGVTVELYTNGVLLASTQTDTNGYYLFSGLRPGTYTVLVVETGVLEDATLIAHPDNDGVPIGHPDALVSNNWTTVTLLPGQTFTGADFGYAIDGVIGDLVWIDANGNGQWDPGEQGIPFIPVTLYSNGTQVATTMTDADGYYIFYGLPDGTYRVAVDTNHPDFPAGLTQTFDPDGILDDQATDIVMSGGIVTHIGGVAYPDDASLDVDFGYQYVGVNRLSGTVGMDGDPSDGVLNGTNTSGVAADEIAFANVTVYVLLWNDDGNGVIDPGETVPLTSTLTDANGDYAFTNLPPGGPNDYYIVSLTAPYDELFLTTTTNDTPAVLLHQTLDEDGHTRSAYQAVPVAPETTNVDFAFKTLTLYDFGDLPDSYRTLLSSDGARHRVKAVPDLYLGQGVSTEPDGRPSADADLDTYDDGVFGGGYWSNGVAGATIRVDVGAGSGWLVGFVDFDQSGAFDKANELVVNQAVSSTGGEQGDGVYYFTFDVPEGTISDTETTFLYSRFRLFPEKPMFPALAYQGEADNGEVEDYRWEFSPTRVVVARFEAGIVDGRAVIEWETASEFMTAGFFLLRAEQPEGPWTQVNDRLLPARPGRPEGAIYRYADDGLRPGQTTWYRLREIEMSGASLTYGPFEVQLAIAQPGIASVVGAVQTLGPPLHAPMGLGASYQLPLDGTDADRFGVADRTSAVPRRLGRIAAPDAQRPAARRTVRRALAATPAEWPALRLAVDQRGMIRVSAAELAAAAGDGIDEADVRTRIAARACGIRYQGVAIPVWTDAAGEWLAFYARPLQTMHADTDVVWLDWSPAAAPAGFDAGAPVPAVDTQTFVETRRFKEDKIPLPNLAADPAADYWYWLQLTGGGGTAGVTEQTVTLPGAESGAPGRLRAFWHGATDAGIADEHWVEAALNQQPIGSVKWSGLKPALLDVAIPDGVIVSGDNTLTLTAHRDDAVPYTFVFLHSVEIDYHRRYHAVDGQIEAPAGDHAVVTVSEFNQPDPMVLDVSDPVAVRQATAVTVNGDAETGWRVSFATGDASDGGRFLAWQAGTGHAVQAVTAVKRRVDLRRRDHVVQYAVVAPESLLDAAAEWAAYRETQGLCTLVVPLRDLYDQFAFGRTDPTAIRDWLAYARSQWAVGPDYLLLAGHGTYDERGRMGNDVCLLPTLMTPTVNGLAASDNAFGDLNGDGLPEVAVGRLPVRSAGEMREMLAKVIAYEATPPGEWGRTMLFLSDRSDHGGDFKMSNERTSSRLSSQAFRINHAAVDTIGVAAARRATLTGFDEGMAYLNFFGHAGLNRLSSHGLLAAADLPAFKNVDRLPVVTLMSCVAGNFAIPGWDALAEDLVLEPGVGAVAVWGPTTVQFNDLSESLATAFYDRVGARETVLGRALLDAYRAFGLKYAARQTVQTYALLGDPALRLIGGQSETQPYGERLARFSDWLDTHFTAAERDDPAISGPLADPDGDGLVNLVEYALGLDPFRADDLAVLRPQLDRSAGTDHDLVLRFVRRRQVYDVQIVIDASDDFTVWVDGRIHRVRVETGPGPTPETETVSVFMRAPGDRQRGFFRLRIGRDQ